MASKDYLQSAVADPVRSRWLDVDFAADSLRRKWVNSFYLCVLYLAVAAASFHGFYEKWGFRDVPIPGYVNEAHYSFSQMLDGSADRPFVYRRLLVQAAANIEAALPETVRQTIAQRLEQRVWWERQSWLSSLQATADVRGQHLIAYCLVYYACFGFLFFSLLLGRSICLELGVTPAASAAAPVIFALILPYMFSMGGFFYDFPELFFLTAASLLAVRGQWLALIPLAAVATLNKDTFLLFTAALYPFLARKAGCRTGRMAVLVLMAVSFAALAYVRLTYAHSAGQSEQIWLRQSVHFYADLTNLFRFEDTFGIEAPRGYSILTFAVLVFLYRGAWQGLGEPVRSHIIIAAIVNIPLVLVFCGPGEMRDFSLCYIGLILVIGQTLSNWLKTASQAQQLQRG